MPARLMVTLTLVLAFPVGAFRACGSVARSSSRIGTSVGARAVTRIPRVSVYPRVTTLPARWGATAGGAGGAARRGAAAGVISDDALRATPRAAEGAGVGGRVVKGSAGNADSVIDAADALTDDDNKP
jgi:hypothetical protein